MFNLSRFASLSQAVRNLGGSRKLFASTSVLAENKDSNEDQKPDLARKTQNPTIAAVFATLNDIEPSTPKIPKKVDLDDIINNAKTVNGLLSIAETQQDISRKHALKIVSTLAEWSSIKRIRVSDFENDSRFNKLCRLLGRAVTNKGGVSNTLHVDSNAKSRNEKKISGIHTEDLNVVLGVTGDDEAAKLVATITLPQMVKVMKNLAIKKRRSTPLLRSLAYHMSTAEFCLDLKQCSDVLYAMASLNFPDEVLLSKLCEDVKKNMKDPVEKSPLIGSIITSLGFLRYREPFVLDTLTNWFVENQDSSRTQDVSALFMSLALLNYLPSGHEEILKKSIATSLTQLDFKNSFEYLGFVWSLMMLNFPLDNLYDSVLNTKFIQKLTAEYSDKELPANAKMKLLNINAGVKFLPTYSGSMLSREEHKDIYDVPLMHAREKQTIVNGMIDAIKSLVPESCVEFNKDTNMGFVIDATFFLDNKGNPVPKESKGGKRVALMVHDFRDLCHGPHQPVNGITALNMRLLEKSGYHVSSVPYHEFSISDKLLKRVQYLEKIIKSINKNQ